MYIGNSSPANQQLQKHLERAWYTVQQDINPEAVSQEKVCGQLRSPLLKFMYYPDSKARYEVCFY